MDSTFVENLRARLTQPLPGRAAQYKMASLRRLEELSHLPSPPPDARIACVLNLLHWREGAWHTVLIERTTNPRDRHAGQISFPGGSWDKSDGGLEDVALRETEEEIGMPSSGVQLLGRLTELYIPVSNFLVYPFVGLAMDLPMLRPQPGEVESILTPPLALFQDEVNRKRTDVTIGQGITLKEVPYFDVDGRIVWGATAMIMSEFLEVMGV